MNDMDFCNIIQWKLGNIDLKVYNTPAKVAFRLGELASLTRSPLDAIDRWVNDNEEILDKYMPSLSKFIARQAKYSLGESSGESTDSSESHDSKALLDNETVDDDLLRKINTNSLSDQESYILQGHNVARARMHKSFSKDMIIAFLYTKINGRYTLVTDNTILNKSIWNYKKLEYNKIIDFINDYIIGSKKYSIKDIIDDEEIVNDEKLKEITRVFEEYLLSIRANIPSELSIGESEVLQRDKSRSTYLKDAIYAYFHVKYFDTLLTQELGSLITYNRDSQDTEIGLYYRDDDLNRQITNKYSRGKDRSTVVKSWHIGEFRDAIAEMTKLARLIFDEVTVYDYRTKQKVSDTVLISLLYMAYDHLRKAISLSKDISVDGGRTTLKTLLAQTDIDSNEYTPKLLKESIKKNVVDNLMSYGLTNDDVNILYSVYHQLLDPDNITITHVENTYLNSDKTSAVPSFLLLDVVLNALNHMSAASYLQTTIDYDGTKTSVINAINRSIKLTLDYITGIDISLLRMTDARRQKLLDDYEIQYKKGDLTSEQIRFKIDDIEYIAFATNSSMNGFSSFASKFMNVRMYRVLSDEDVAFIQNVINTRYQDLKDLLDKFISVFNNPDTKNKIYINESFSNLYDAVKSKRTFLRENNQVDTELDQVYNILSQYTFPSIGVKNINSMNNDADNMKEHKNMLKFMQELLLLDLTSNDGLWNLSYTLLAKGVTLNNILSSALHIAAIHSVMLDFHNEQNRLRNEEGKDVTFDEYMSSKDIGYDAIKYEKGYTTTEYNGEKSFKAFNPSDEWIDKFFKAKSELDATDSGSVSKTKGGNDVNLYRPINVLSRYREIMSKLSVNENSASKNTLFVNQPNSVVAFHYNKEVQTITGESEEIKKLTVAKLLYNSIEHNLFNAFRTNKHFFITPTVFADKTAFGTFEIDLANTYYNLGTDEEPEIKPLSRMTVLELRKVYFDTTSDFYKRSSNTIRKRYTSLFNYIARNSDSDLFIREYQDGLFINHEYSLSEINNILKKINLDQFRQFVQKYNTDLALAKLINDNNLLSQFLIRENLSFGKEGYYVKRPDGNLQLNESLTGYAILGTDLDKIRFDNEIFNFAQQLIKYNILIDTSKGSVVDLLLSGVDGFELIREFVKDSKDLKDGKKKFLEQWSSVDGKLIIAKDVSDFAHAITEEDVKNAKERNIYTERDLYESGGDFILNPLLIKYFYLYNVCSKNIMMPLLGYEIGQDNKTAKIDMSKEFDYNSRNTNDEPKTQKEIDILSDMSQTQSGRKMINALKSMTLTDLIFFFNESEGGYLKDVIKDKITRLVSLSIASRESSMFKRNMVATATMTPMLVNSISGLGRYTKVATVEDVLAYMFNPKGESAQEDAHDGSGPKIPLQAILENNSLGADSVGYELAKTIWFNSDDETGCYTLAKWATPTLTNQYVRLGLDSEHNPMKLLKKMMHIRWYGTIDLTRQALYIDNGESGSIDFAKHILNTEGIQGSSLIYTDNGKLWEIKNFLKNVYNIQGRLVPVYITEEISVKELEEWQKKSNNISLTPKKKYVAHLFNEDGEHIKIRSNDNISSYDEFVKYIEDLNSEYNILEQYHSIDSLYELWQALGGINSKHKEGNDYVFSENSNYALAAFVNTVSEHIEGREYKLNQTNYYQPLKDKFIGYIANNSSMKSFALNVNSVNVMENNEDLLWAQFDNSFLGVAQDPDHEADESHVREMTLVIASLDAGSQTHTYADEAYKALRSLATRGMWRQLNTIGLILSLGLLRQNIHITQQLLASEIYHMIAAEFLRQYKPNKTTDLSTIIVSKVKEDFSRQIRSNHGLDLNGEIENLLPISDANIFNQLMLSIASTITNRALKREYSGTGDVLIPGFKKTQIHHFRQGNNVYELTYDDILKEASKGKAIINKNNIVKIGLSEIGQIDNNNFVLTTNFRPNRHLLFLAAVELTDNYKLGDTLSVTNDLSNIFGRMLTSLGWLRIGDNNYIKGFEHSGRRDNGYIQSYLETELAKPIYMHHSATWFQPTDIVNVICDGEYLFTVNLDLMQKYQDFIYYFSNSRYRQLAREKYDAVQSLLPLDDQILYNDWIKMQSEATIDSWAREWGITSKTGSRYKYLKESLYTDLVYQENIVKPLDLRPQLITFVTEDGVRHNLYQLDAIVDAHLSESNRNKHYVWKENPVRDLELIQQQIKDLVEKGIAHINGEELKILPETLDIQSAEAIMSNMHQSKFDQGTQSMYESTKRFKERPIKRLILDNASLIIESDKQIYGIILDQLLSMEGFERVDIPESITKVDDEYRIYAESTREHDIDYEIGYLERRSDYKYQDKAFFDLRGNKLENQGNYLIIDGIIYEKKYTVEEYKKKNGKFNNRYIRFNLDNVPQRTRALYIGNRIKEIMDSKKLNSVQLNGTFDIQRSKVNLIKSILEEVKDTHSNNSIRNKSIEYNIEFLNNIRTNSAESKDVDLYKFDPNISPKSYDESVLKEFNKYKRDIQKLHFELTKYITAARIPSQSLQSYMKMKVVAFLPTLKNLVIVSHFQTWLQGSDYDVDKAYIMSFSFTNNGEFYDWSPLFDYSSNETTLASLTLPLPNNISISKQSENKLNVANQARELVSLQEKYNIITNNEGQSLDRLNIVESNDFEKPLAKDLRREGITEEEYFESSASYVNIRTNKAIRFYLNEESDRIDRQWIDLVKEGNKSYSLDFHLDNTTEDPITLEQRDRLLKAIASSLSEGNLITLYDNVSRETLDALNEFLKLGFVVDSTILLSSSADDILVLRKNTNRLKANIIEKKADLIRFIDEHSIESVDLITIDENGDNIFENNEIWNDIVKDISDHESYNIEVNNQEDTYKNFISSRIQLINSHPLNMLLAYSPVSIDEVREPAKYTPLAYVSKGLTTMNPATQAIMQQLNMEGKEDIGIFAVGERIFMGLTYYFADAIKNGRNLNYKKFDHITRRIKGRSQSTPSVYERTIITDVKRDNDRDENLEKLLLYNKVKSTITEEEYEKFLSLLEDKNADLVISALLSAATDNAKELILTCINAGQDYAKMYIHLVIMGYDIKDIVAFMTSNAALILTDMTREGSFDDHKISLNYAVKILKGESDWILPKYIVDFGVGKKRDELIRDLLFTTDKNILSQIRLELETTKNPKQYASLMRLLRLNERITRVNENQQDFYDDVADFQLVFNEADETSTIGHWMGMARQVHPIQSEFLSTISKRESEINNVFSKSGIKFRFLTYTSEDGSMKIKTTDTYNGLTIELQNAKKLKEDIQKIRKLYSDYDVESSINDALKFGILVSDIMNDGEREFYVKFSLLRFIDDMVYREVMIKFYDMFRKNFNVLDIITSIPLYEIALKGWSTTMNMQKISSIKGFLSDKIREDFLYTGFLIDKKFAGRIPVYIDELLISNFLKKKENKLSFVIPKGELMYDDNMDIVRAENDVHITINRHKDIQNYKLWFETYLVPALKGGRVVLNNEEYIINTDNEFIRSLLMAKDGYTIMYKLNVMMDSLDNNEKVTARYNAIVNGFHLLDKDIKDGDPKITDYFMLYNLIVSRNNPGRDRMTSLFSDKLYQGNTLLNKFDQYLGYIDIMMRERLNDDESMKKLLVDELGYSIEDAAIRLAPSYSYRAQRHGGEPYIFVRGNDGINRLHKRQTGLSGPYAKYEPVGLNVLPFLNSRDLGVNSARMIRFLNDGLLFYLPNSEDKTSIKAKLTKSDNIDDIVLALRDLSLMGKISITINCL